MKTPIALVLLAIVAALGLADDKKTDDKTIAEVAMGSKDFSTLIDAVKAAELTDAFKGDGPITVFAPTNAAFEKLGKDKLAELHANKKKLAEVLLSHVVKGKVTAEDVKKLKGKDLDTMGSKFAVRTNADAITVGGANVTKTDIVCKNGIIHVIDGVLIPDELK
ncbi:fasciclin domain-containing protein [Limnoglobus roseus]|uniref:Beta-Ig-H3/fasciclin n=1 Tax=Limnoglobus roseus TaxID=2598579 RepID=A0A5C1AAF8_9BACT|nr:fasciclin domain-containing protein [Limnoglobus roseus]QEL15710.1 beta-Ig-H3/fasciclin [Limnoglobus roseus]